MSVLDNFDQWKRFLGERLEQAQGKGIGGNAVSDMAFRVGDYLANEVEAQNDQEKLLAEHWKVANEQEQHTIANLKDGKIYEVLSVGLHINDAVAINNGRFRYN
ncbi:hypothetical protein BK732_07415 [Bacillus thuringiensis serovar navarrensis]|uniref:DUF3243 domain-containing protein n=1 Tax=Bacillus thuringiensis serovar navarrensis TaxID=339658 RepID=A0A243AJL9_BACTU|nr:hypothetical protein BK732_07415 [Bacillus thuringiensis serovar navarrensis]